MKQKNDQNIDLFEKTIRELEVNDSRENSKNRFSQNNKMTYQIQLNETRNFQIFEKSSDYN